MTTRSKDLVIKVEYWPPGSPHGHNFMDIMENGHLDGEQIEDIAGGLSEAILACNEGRHNGHGRTHTHEDAEMAYKAAVQQILTTDFVEEYRKLMQRIATYYKWGGTRAVPKFAIMPTLDDEGRGFKMLMPDEQGDPHLYDISKRAKGLLEEAIEPPDPKKTFPDRQGLGYMNRAERRRKK
jgi:hypothetical protein